MMGTEGVEVGVIVGVGGFSVGGSGSRVGGINACWAASVCDTSVLMVSMDIMVGSTWAGPSIPQAVNRVEATSNRSKPIYFTDIFRSIDVL
jgi:hypothetical protein